MGNCKLAVSCLNPHELGGVPVVVLSNLLVMTFILAITLSCFSWFSSPVEATSSTTLELDIANVKSEKGVIWIGIYESEERFLDRDRARLVSVPVSGSRNMRIRIPDVPVGEIAIAIFHDRNNNGELDRSLAGIPSEPFAFSGKVKSRWRLPKFEEVKVPFSSGNNRLAFKLMSWWQF